VRLVEKRNKADSNSYTDNQISQKILEHIQKKFKISDEQLKKVLSEIITKLPKRETCPLSIFNERITVLESVVKYLREEKNLSLHKIAEILGRDEKNIWHAYHSANKKMSAKLKVDSSSISIPLSIFSDGKLAPLEAIVVHLKEQQQMSLHEIAVILARDDRTIWTAYTRARRKYENKE
jgi:DNA-binding CsgD family transcriptional regulator